MNRIASGYIINRDHDIDRIKYFANPSNIDIQHKEEIERLLRLDVNNLKVLNFDNKKAVAQIFASILDTKQFHEIQDSYDEFMTNKHQKKQSGIDQKIIYPLRQKRDYSKYHTMVKFSNMRNSIWYKLQLDNHQASDFIMFNHYIPQDGFEYIIPNLYRQYRHDIAQHAMIGYNKPRYYERMIRLIKNFDIVLVPMLQGAEGMRENSDSLQQQTSRIVRLPMWDNSDATFGRLVMQYTPDQQIHKRHQYKSDTVRIEFYTNKDAIIDSFQSQQSSLDQQIQRLTIIYDSYKIYTPQYVKELYQMGKQNEILELLHSSQLKAIGYTLVESLIQSKSLIIHNNRYITSQNIKAVQNRLQEQIYKAEAIKEKNQLHIESLGKYEM